MKILLVKSLGKKQLSLFIYLIFYLEDIIIELYNTNQKPTLRWNWRFFRRKCDMMSLVLLQPMRWGAVWPQGAASRRPQRAAPASTSRWSQRPANAGAVAPQFNQAGIGAVILVVVFATRGRWRWCVLARAVVAPTWARGSFHAVGGVLPVLNNTETENKN